ncbi:MAG: 3-oxoacyl-ACP reductase [Candidatus Marinimicrobia bacterium]|nr:3-oxoacyl-ACP reductase [Candidatus Neomarinimicrobiota bacterium]
MTDQEQIVAIVTGAGSGIGRNFSLALLNEGYSVVLAGREKSKLEKTTLLSQKKSRKSLILPTDITDESAVKNLFKKTNDHFGRIDLVFNNAGIAGPPDVLEDIVYKDWKAVVDTNLTGAFLCTREAFIYMKTQDPIGGRIINNGSISAHVPRPNSAPYTSAKHAISGLTKSTALEGRKYNIACGQIDIGNASTSMTDKMLTGVPQADGSIKQEDTMGVDNVTKALMYMAKLPLDANVLSMTVIATKMPYVGRG